jgi:hypothetical protein
MPKPILAPVYNASPTRVVEYLHCYNSGDFYHEKKNTAWKQKREFRDDISANGDRRLSKAIDWFYYLTPKQKINNIKDDRSFNYKLAMLTFTLPCSQIQDDLYIKKYLLNGIMSRLRAKYQINNYIWKAEKTQKGNIHFHLLVDKWINYKDINYNWNSLLKEHGYIQQYRKNQLDFHKFGFKLRTELLSSWDQSEQYKAYKKGMQTNWSFPEGTSHIKSLRNIKNVREYIKKYLCKKTSKNVITNTDRQPNSIANSNVADYQYNFTPEIRQEQKEISKTAIRGNIWHVSQSLSKIENPYFESSQTLSDDLEKFRRYYPDKYIDSDFYSIYIIGFDDKKLNQFPYLKQKILEGLVPVKEKYFKQYQLALN